MKLYSHQQRFIDENPDRALLCWGCGTGKTLAAVVWMKLRPTISFVVVCPKQILKMWESVAPANAVVVTKEQYKKYTAPYSGIVVDEADHGFGSALFTKGRSAMATTLYTWIRTHDTSPVLLLTATPIRNAPHTSHTLLTYLQKAVDWKSYRTAQYNLVHMPYNPRPFYQPKKGWQKFSAEMITRNSSVADLSDIADVPVQYDEKVSVNGDWFVAGTRIELPWHDKARAESGTTKLNWIKEYAKDKRKVVIVSRYLDTIMKWGPLLSKERETFVVTGGTKDQEAVIMAARDSFECYLLVQSSLGSGFELPEFDFMIFASLSFSVRDLTQMKGRILRLNRLKSNWYTYLIGGKCDESVYRRTVIEGQDFVI
jgi:superfamily II DNA or RNA helicase